MLRIPLVLLMLCTSSAAQEQRYTLSVDVELVNVTATVIDASGRYIESLTERDFQVLEDGREQTISFFSHDTRIPVSIGVLIDSSGSHQDKLEQGLQIVSEIAAMLSPGDEMFVITFNSRAVLRQKFTSSAGEIQRALVGVRAGGETAVYDAISLGLDELKAAKNRKQILVLLTDGFDTRSKIKAAEAEESMTKSDALVYAIGIDDDDNNPRTRKRPRYHIYEYMLGRLTSAGRGRLIRLYAGRNYNRRSLAEMLVGELHQEYTMGYYPTAGPERGGARSIEVRLTKPGARILGERLYLQRRDVVKQSTPKSSPVN